MSEIRKLNRLKAVLAEQSITGKSLAEELKVSPITVSRWSQNITQPDLETLSKIADILQIDPRDLLNGKE